MFHIKSCPVKSHAGLNICCLVNQCALLGRRQPFLNLTLLSLLSPPRLSHSFCRSFFLSYLGAPSRLLINSSHSRSLILSLCAEGSRRVGRWRETSQKVSLNKTRIERWRRGRELRDFWKGGQCSQVVALISKCNCFPCLFSLSSNRCRLYLFICSSPAFAKATIDRFIFSKLLGDVDSFTKGDVRRCIADQL